VHVALLIQHATFMRHIVTSFVVPLAPPYFSIISDKRNFSEKNLVNVKRVLISSTTFVYNISHSKNNLARYCHKCEKVFILSSRYCCQFLRIVNFLDRFSNKA
jgi:hypothetical protein